MSSATRTWLCIVSAASFAFGSAPAKAGSELGTFSPKPPLQPTVFFFKKSSSVNDFSVPWISQDQTVTHPLGDHLQYFPAFDLAEPASGLSTGDPSCIELTPDFANFRHDVPWDFTGRTFSPDAPAGPGEPVGVKSAGGVGSWAMFTLPDGRVGRSGTTYDKNACDNSSNTVNQIFVNSSGLHDFCLNIITDNTYRTHDPDKELEARVNDVNASLQGDGVKGPFENEVELDTDQRLSFDGQPDMYTFRYMGVGKNDRIKIRIQNQDEHCAGAGFGGIMVSHIDTCMPQPADECTPNCEGRICGDDGCGGSCGICPRVDILEERSGDVTVTVPAGSRTVTDVETVVALGDMIGGALESAAKGIGEDIEAMLVEIFDHELDINVRNFRFKLDKKLDVRTQARADGDFDVEFKLSGFDLKWKLTPEDDVARALCHDVVISVHVGTLRLTGKIDPNTNNLQNVEGHISDPDSDADFDCLGLNAFAPMDIFDWFGFEIDIPGLDVPMFPLIGDNLVEFALDTFFEYFIEEELEGFGDDLDALKVPLVALVPPTLPIGGVDYAGQIRDAILDPPVGQVSSFAYDGNNPHKLSGNAPKVETEVASFTANVGTQFALRGSLRSTAFPPIVGGIERAYRDAPYPFAGGYTVEGWTCGEDFGESLDVGVFANGYALEVAKADGDASTEVAEQCGTSGVFNKYRFSLHTSAEKLGCLNAWEHQFTVVSGRDGFEKGLGEVPRASAQEWLPANIEGIGSPGEEERYGDTYNENRPERHFVADFNGDGAADYLFENEGWWVAISNGDGFADPQPWLGKFWPGAANGRTYNSAEPQRHFVADFDGDHLPDYMWESGGWWVARSSGAGFYDPELWLGTQVAGDVETVPSDDHPGLQFVGDFTGDGRADFLWRSHGVWWVARSVAIQTGTGIVRRFEPPSAGEYWLDQNIPGTNNERTYAGAADHNIVGDFNGDGRADFMFFNDGWWVALATVNPNPALSHFTISKWLENDFDGIGQAFGEDPGLTRVGDFNGDGKLDLMFMRGGWWVALGIVTPNGPRFATPVAWLARKTGGEYSQTFNPEDQERHFIADFDGDGRDDYLWGYHGWKVALSEGDRFAAPRYWLPSKTVDDGWTFNEDFEERHFVADFTADGLPDYLWENDGWRVASTLVPDYIAGDEENPDGDCDGVPDEDDVCPVDPDPEQEDLDGDGVGNACDTECADGVNNDGDSLVDYPADPGCESADSALEAPECDDGVDNDGDGKVDTLDYNCVARYIDDERYPVMNECNDGLDNDGDGEIDHFGGPLGEPADDWCAANTGKELEPPYHQCGLGFEVAPVLLALMYLRRRRQRAARSR